MTDLDLCYLSATELTRRIQDRVVSPVDLVENALERIAEINPKLNCFCFVYPEQARAKARKAEEAVRQGRVLNALHGVPYAIKDLTPTKGKRTTLGSYAYENWVPEEDAPIVEDLDRAGGILIGKTTTPEFAYSSFTESPLWGITRNPWDPSRTPGGSSGGSAAAVASGCVPIAEGSDMGGSVRIPASFCGIVGLKPSFGRIPFTILPSIFDSLSHFGPLARTIDDAALFLGITQGPDERDIQSLKPRITVPRPISGSIRGWRLALSIDLGFLYVDPEVEAAIRAAAAALTEQGAVIEEVELGWTREMNDAWIDHWRVYLAAFFGDKLPEYRSRMDPNVVALIEAGLKMSAVEFKRIEFIRTDMWRKLAPILQRCHALLCPTMAHPAPHVGGKDTNYDWLDEQGRFHGLDITSVFNFVSQCPALSVPAGTTANGLPIGLQIVARRFEDVAALSIGKALEMVRPWAQRRPSI
jgi:Asp-tRNA(Asn)/Glu-tRNA(Gln) amidotransferase A subunit family amidase